MLRFTGLSDSCEIPKSIWDVAMRDVCPSRDRLVCREGLPVLLASRKPPSGRLREPDAAGKWHQWQGGSLAKGSPPLAMAQLLRLMHSETSCAMLVPASEMSCEGVLKKLLKRTMLSARLVPDVRHGGFGWGLSSRRPQTRV